MRPSGRSGLLKVGRVGSLAERSFFPYFLTMLAKLTSKNQLTLPKRLIEAVGSPPYFDATLEDGRIVLSPARIGNADAVRRKLAQIGITQDDVTEAVAWARKRG